MARRIIIDTDPGIDDAVAILLALAAPEELEALGIVAVAGNLPLALTERNARQICELARRPDLAVYAGCARPLLRAPATASGIHGDALRDRLQLPDPAMPLRAQHGVDFLIDAVRAAEPGSITVAALGPLTDIAMALVKAPDIAARVAELVIMGGAGFEIGNITPAAEFNIHVDPHAAEIVLGSGIPITMIPLDVTHQALDHAAADRGVAGARQPLRSGGRFVAGRFRRDAYREIRRGAAWRLHDPCVIAYLLRPALFSGREVNVAVETASPLTLGMTVVDWWGVTGRKANARFLTTVDAAGFFDVLTERLARLP